MAVFARSGNEPAKAQLRNVSAEINSEFTDELKVTDSDTVTWTKNPGIIQANVTSLPSSIISTVSGSNRLLDHNKHSDTTDSVPVAGALVYANSTPEWDDLTPPTSEGQILTANSSLLPVWANPSTGTTPPWTSDQFPRRHGWTTHQVSTVNITSGGAWFADAWTRVSSGAGAVGSTVAAYNSSGWVHSSTASANAAYYRRLIGADQESDISWINKPVVRYNFTVIYDSSDASKYAMWAAIYNPSTTGAGGVIPMSGGAGPQCATGNSTVVGACSGRFALCWSKATQANIQLCTMQENAANGTQNCRDTGIAIPASGTRVDLILDAQDASNFYAYINPGTGTYTKFGPYTTNLPTVALTVGDQVSFDIGTGTTAITVDVGVRVNLVEAWFD